MPKRLMNASTVVGAGLGGATGLAINRLALGNKSLVSNLVSIGLGSAFGGTAGYLLNSYLQDTSDPQDNVIKNNVGKPARELDNGLLSLVMDAVKEGSSSDKAVALRGKLRDYGMGDSDIQELFNAAEDVKDGFELRPISRSVAGISGMAASDWMFRKVRDIATGKDAKGAKGEKSGVAVDTVIDLGAGKGALNINPNNRTVTYSGGALSSATGADANRIADELSGDARVKQGWWYRKFGTPSEKAQAQFIHDNVTKHRLENAPGIKKLLAKLNARNTANPMALKLRNVVNRIGKVYVPAGTGKRLARVGGKGARLGTAGAGALLGLLLESSMHEANPKLIKRFRDLE